MQRAKGLALGVPARCSRWPRRRSEHRRTSSCVDNLPEATNATAINFLRLLRTGAERQEAATDVMLVTGRFGLKSYSLSNPRRPQLLDEITVEDLRLPGDPPVNFDSATPPLDVLAERGHGRRSQDRKLVLLSRDPRAYARLDDPGARRGRPERGDQHRRRLRRRRARIPSRPEDPVASSSCRPATRPPASTTASGCGRAARRRRTSRRRRRRTGPSAARSSSPTSRPAEPARLPDGSGRPVPARRRDRVLARRPGRRHGHRLGLGRRRHARLLDRGPPLGPAQGPASARRRR